MSISGPIGPGLRRKAIRWFWLGLFGCSFCAGLRLASQRFAVALVVGDSMLPTLKSGMLLVIDRKAYAVTDPGRGDVVVIGHRGERIVKRVVGLPGEEVELSAGKLIINGKAMPESYPVNPGYLEVGKGQLYFGKFAVVGDNRSPPPEQLVHGVYPREEFLGKVVIAGWSGLWN